MQCKDKNTSVTQKRTPAKHITLAITIANDKLDHVVNAVIVATAPQAREGLEEIHRATGEGQ